MLATLGAKTILAAAVGKDDEGRLVRQLLDNLEINHRLVLPVGDRPTTLKERFLGCASSAIPTR